MDEFIFITSEGEPAPEDKQALVSGLLSHHANQGHPRKTDTYSIFMRDQNNKPVAGVILSFLWNGMHIDSLWVDESLRGKGYGAKLMTMAEDEGRNRNCTISYTDTFTWQAPGFYEKLGYTLYGKLDGFPEGNTLSYYSKKL